ncbi:hypothetical protein cypCar_00036473 [Cyprinus carpio]|nr:hypothetical protein cypCar_00036473 [Cyprinus carpio]
MQESLPQRGSVESESFIIVIVSVFAAVCLAAIIWLKLVKPEHTSEFHRITNISLKNKFYAELDNHTPRLIAVYRQKAARTGKAAEALRSICSAYDLTDHYDINNRRTVALRALPVYFREDDSVFFKMWNTEELDEPDIADSAVALVSMVNGESSSIVQFDPAGIAIVLEGDIVLRDISRFIKDGQICDGMNFT